MKKIFSTLGFHGLFVMFICMQANDTAIAQTWTNYKTANPVQAIAVDAQDNKWFVSGSDALKFNGTNWTTYRIPDSSDYFSSVAIDRKGNKWFGGIDGVYKFDGITWTNYLNPQSLLGFSNALAIDAQGNIWVGGTFSKGVYKFDGTTWTRYYGATTTNKFVVDDVNAIAIDAQDNKWFGTDKGVYKFDGTTWTKYTTSQGVITDNVKAIAIDSQGNKWFGTFFGVAKFDGTTWKYYTGNNDLMNSSVESISIDAQGNKWFGTWGGVSKFDGTTWTSYTTENTNGGLLKNWINAMAIDAQDNKWFTFTTSDGVSKLSGKTNSDKTPPQISYTLYPNPIERELFLTLNAPKSGKANFSIVDMYGRMVYQTSQFLIGQNQDVRLDLQMLPRGIYLLKIEQEGLIWQTRKFVKVK